ncbi:protein of unknown function [Burkholderia multivorans]
MPDGRALQSMLRDASGSGYCFKSDERL